MLSSLIHICCNLAQQHTDLSLNSCCLLGLLIR